MPLGMADILACDKLIDRVSTQLDYRFVRLKQLLVGKAIKGMHVLAGCLVLKSACQPVLSEQYSET